MHDPLLMEVGQSLHGLANVVAGLHLREVPLLPQPIEERTVAQLNQ